MRANFQIKIAVGFLLVGLVTNAGSAQSPPMDLDLIPVWSSQDRDIRLLTDPPDEFGFDRVPHPAFGKFESRRSDDIVVCEPQMPRPRPTMTRWSGIGTRLGNVRRSRDFWRDPVQAVLR